MKQYLTFLMLLLFPCVAFGYTDLNTDTFLTRDPAGMIDGPNLYTYVNQNPWTHFDPEGLDPNDYDSPTNYDSPSRGWVTNDIDALGTIINGGATSGAAAEHLLNQLYPVQQKVDNAALTLVGGEVAAPVVAAGVKLGGSGIELAAGYKGAEALTDTATDANAVNKVATGSTTPGPVTAQSTSDPLPDISAQLKKLEENETPQVHQQDEQQVQSGPSDSNGTAVPKVTVIGTKADLLSGKYDADMYDHWFKSGRVPDVDAGDPPVTWAENRGWLNDRIARGDSFELATDPETLPPVRGGYIPGTPNGYFTAREVEHLQQQGQTIKYGDSNLPPPEGN